MGSEYRLKLSHQASYSISVYTAKRRHGTHEKHYCKEAQSLKHRKGLAYFKQDVSPAVYILGVLKACPVLEKACLVGWSGTNTSIPRVTTSASFC